MSTLNFNKNDFSSTAPIWTLSIPEQLYHADSHAGRFLSSSMLREFRRCPAQYNSIVNGNADVPAGSSAFRLGRAAHKLILEGEQAYRRTYIVGGPWNENTGRPFSHGCRAFLRWAEEYGLNPEGIVTPTEEAMLRRMFDAAACHEEAAKLLEQGWPERVARADIGCVPCQARIDWLRPDGVLVDLKTTSDIGRFEDDARRFGYLNQFAFYRDVARAAGGSISEVVAIVLEKRKPFRAGVWRFDDAVLEPYAVQNLTSIKALAKCRKEKRWLTGYEGARAFPPASLPPLWLN